MGLKARSKQEKYDLIGNKKINCSLSLLCRGIPDEFRDYLDLTRNLQFDHCPDYNRYIKMFQKLFQKRGFIDDNIFD